MDHTPHMEHLHNDLFGNISKIFKQQKIFLNRIQACNDNVEAIGRAFVENVSMTFILLKIIQLSWQNSQFMTIY